MAPISAKIIYGGYNQVNNFKINLIGKETFYCCLNLHLFDHLWGSPYFQMFIAHLYIFVNFPFKIFAYLGKVNEFFPQLIISSFKI